MVKMLIVLLLVVSVHTMQLPECHDYWTDEIGFACSKGGEDCFHNSYRCNGQPQCPGATDELGCECSHEDTFVCAMSGECLNKKFRCNSVLDCVDGSDEHNCDYTSASLTEGCETYDGLPGFLCPGDDYCWHSEFRCDGTPDCPWSADESGCECGPKKFVCASDGVCLSQELRCNTIQDCLDGSDELDCNYAEYTGELVGAFSGCLVNATGATGFTCHASNDSMCIDSYHRCNGYRYCPDAEDEIGCECNLADQFLCKNGVCLNEQYRCNSINDCGDGSDEEGCEYHGVSKTEECIDYEGFIGFNCSSDFYCISSEWRCDGEADCPDWKDETGCGKDRPDRFLCETGGISLDIKFHCNQVKDCPDGSDERRCEFSNDNSNTKKCKTWTGNTGFKCINYFQCLPSQERCDGKPYCPGGEDEIACVCGSDKFLCNNGVCLDKTLRCNTVIDCSDGSDEIDCNYVYPDCVEKQELNNEQEDEEGGDGDEDEDVICFH